MIDWGNTPPGSTATIYWPQVLASDVIALASQSYSSHLLAVVDDHTLQCTVTEGVTYIPIPTANNLNFAGLLTIDLPKTITKGQEFNLVVRRVSTRQAPPPPPPIQTEARKAAGDPMPAPVPGKGPVVPQSWRQITGAFQVRIPVTTKDIMLPPEEDTLAVLKWRLGQMSKVYRWYPVVKRYAELVAARVDGLGGDSQKIPPSLNGFPGGHEEPCGPLGDHHSGKIESICYDCHGRLQGFVLKAEHDKSLPFECHEQGFEELIRTAWDKSWAITVYVLKDHPDQPGEICLGKEDDD